MHFLFSRCDCAGDCRRAIAVLVSRYPPHQERSHKHQFSCFPSPLGLGLSVSAKEAQAGRIKDIYISLTVLKGLFLLPYHTPFMGFLTGSLSGSRLCPNCCPDCSKCVYSRASCPQNNSKKLAFY